MITTLHKLIEIIHKNEKEDNVFITYKQFYSKYYIFMKS